MAKATIRQKLAFNKLVSCIKDNQSFDMKTIMLDSGYSKATAKNPELNLLNKAGFKQLLELIDDSVLLAKIYSIALDDDKRSSLAGVDMLMKLKGRYPDKNIRIGKIDEMLQELAD